MLRLPTETCAVIVLSGFGFRSVESTFRESAWLRRIRETGDVRVAQRGRRLHMRARVARQRQIHVARAIAQVQIRLWRECALNLDIARARAHAGTAAQRHPAHRHIARRDLDVNDARNTVDLDVTGPASHREVRGGRQTDIEVNVRRPAPKTLTPSGVLTRMVTRSPFCSVSRVIASRSCRASDCVMACVSLVSVAAPGQWNPARPGCWRRRRRSRTLGSAPTANWRCDRRARGTGRERIPWTRARRRRRAGRQRRADQQDAAQGDDPG